MLEKRGSEFQINTNTANAQGNPKIAVAQDGSFVLTWESWGQDGSGYGVYARRFDRNGIPLTDEFQVNTNIVSDQGNPAIAIADDGSFVITWESWSQDGSGYGVYAQRYDANANPVGSEFKVNTTIASWQWHPTIATAPDGSFVIAWESWAQDGSGYGIFAQRFDSNGNPVSSEFQVNTTITNSQTDPIIAMASDGSFVMVWESLNQDGSSSGIYARKFGSNGVALTSEIQVNTTTANAQEQPTIRVASDGSFVIAWQSLNQDGSSYGIYARKFGSNGTALTNEFQVNTTTANSQSEPAIAIDSEGNFTIVWQSSGQDGSNNGIYAQQFDTNANPIGSEFLVNTTTSDDQSMPTIGIAPDGKLTIAWQSRNQDGSSYGVFAQEFVPPTIIEFSQSNFQVSEDAGNSQIVELTRSGYLSESSQVQVTFTGGSATGGDDYDATTVTVTFAAGEVTKKVEIPIIQDFRVEVTESINLAISSIDAYIGSKNTATLEILDDDIAEVTITPTDGSNDITEDGVSDTYEVVLTSQPTAEVTINLSTNGQSTTDSTALVFTSSNWNTPQTVTITAVDDAVAEGNHTSTINHTTSSNDTNYDGLTVAPVTVEITDNDIQGTSDADILLGTSGNDRIVGLGGADTLTGGDGNDLFVYNSVSDGLDTITDFIVGADQIVLTDLLDSIGYTGSDAFLDGYIGLKSMGVDTIVQVDTDGVGGSEDFIDLILVSGVNSTELSAMNNFVF